MITYVYNKDEDFSNIQGNQWICKIAVVYDDIDVAILGDGDLCFFKEYWYKSNTDCIIWVRLPDDDVPSTII